MMFRLGECKHCGGDLHIDIDEWKCLQCARGESYVGTPIGFEQLYFGPVRKRRGSSIERGYIKSNDKSMGRRKLHQ
jgi:hypothetical protein